MHGPRSGGIIVLAVLAALVAGCGGEAKKTSYGSSLEGVSTYQPGYAIGIPKTSSPTSDHGWLSVENHSGGDTYCLIDGFFNTPFQLGSGDVVSVQPSKSATVDWAACGGDVSRSGFPGAAAVSELGWDPAGPNITLTFLGDSFTVSTG